MTQILTAKERLTKVKTVADLNAQIQDAMQVLQRVQQDVKKQIPLEMRHYPNAARMFPELRNKISRAKKAHDLLRSNYPRYSAMLKQGKKII